MVTIKIDSKKCIGCGACEAICPITFKIKNGKSTIKKQPKKITCEEEAANSCPVQAIRIEK
ncbi:MAG: ferredoxin [Candidatus Pacearchaeota archaeon]